METDYSVNKDVESSRRESTASDAAHILYSGRPSSAQNGVNHMNEMASNESSRVMDHIQPEAQINISNHFSPVRRLFCLLTVFDFLLLSILWFFYAQLLGLNGYYGITCQVTNYNFRTSMFDVVLLSFWRMVILLLVYGLIYSKRWYIVVLATMVTCVMVIAKVFLYDYSDKATKDLPPECQPKGTSSAIAVFFMLISSFIISWFELWTFDFQVIPRERKIEQAALMRSSSIDENTPLLGHNYPYNIPPQVINGVQVRPGQRPFYSPYESPADSDQEESESSSQYSSGGRDLGDFQSLPNSQKASTINLAASLQEQKYVQQSQEAMELFERIMRIDDGWEIQKSQSSVAVFTRKINEALKGKFFKMVAVLPAPVERVFEIMWDEFEFSPEWNTSLKQAEVVQHIGSGIQVEYSITNPVGGGLVSSRDFVSIRQHKEEGEKHIVSDVSIVYPNKPPTQDHVRGENGVSGWVVEPTLNMPDSCKLTWFINTDAKIKFVPQNLYESIMCTSLIDIYKGLCGHIEKTGSSSFVEPISGSKENLFEENGERDEDEGEDEDEMEEEEESSEEDEGIVEKMEEDGVEDDDKDVSEASDGAESWKDTFHDIPN